MALLKIGVLIDDTNLEIYKTEILKELQKSDLCKITKFIKKEKENNLQTGSSKYLFYRFFNKIDAKLFGRGAKYLALGSIENIINSCKEEEPDVIINLSSSTKHYSNNAKYGIWQFIYNSYPNAYWEVVNSDPYTEVRLEKSGLGFENGLILNSFKTQTDQKSMLKNQELIAWRSHMMLVRELEKLAQKGKKYFIEKKTVLSFNHNKLPVEKKIFDPQFSFSDKKHYQPPTNIQMIGVVYKLLKKYLTFTIRKFLPMDRWFILYSKTKNGEINPNLAEYKRFYAPSKDYFIADCFIVDEDDKSYLFYEELAYSSFKG